MNKEQEAVVTLLSILEIPLAIKGFFAGFNSYALIADAIESNTDIFASMLVLFGIIF
jgi:divalent metal cation (Fe/Co/Zn/Cd) transporter